MTLELEIETVGVPEGLLPFLESVAEACLAEEGISGAFAAMRIVDEQTIRSVNAAQRGVDAVTDVLSFPSCRFRQGTARDNPNRLRREYDPSVGKAFLGDILLCLKRAGEQAEEYGHSLRRELGYLTAHAMFHLMGYDHMVPEDKARMRPMEEKALARLGIRRETEMTGGDDMSQQELFALAAAATERSYAPYSGFHVGACLLAEDGRTFTGCNIENASYGATICAERCAVSCAVSSGARRFTAIAIAARAGDDGWAYAWPCGICRQVLNEFSLDMDVIVGKPGEPLLVKKLSALLPESFGPKDLGL